MSRVGPSTVHYQKVIQRENSDVSGEGQPVSTTDGFGC